RDFHVTGVQTCALPIWLLGKFAYGEIDKDLKDEQVDVYVLRNCTGAWELLGSAMTTEERAHPTVEGVEDTGGWVYFQVPEDQQRSEERRVGNECRSQRA